MQFLSVPIDFANAAQSSSSPVPAIAEIYQLGAPFTAVVSAPATVLYSAPMSAVKWREMSANILIAGDNTTAGTLAIQCADDIPPMWDSADFMASILGWATPPAAATISVSGNGTYISDVTLICCNWIRFAFTPTAGTAGTIQGVVRFQSPT